MKVAFTAPMKPLDHPVPSGDRTMGRLVVKALQSKGHDVEIASHFRSWRKAGGRSIQEEAQKEALYEAEQVCKIWDDGGYKPDLFVTYHLYHKAPDWIGPFIADAYKIPYVIIEASRAPKRQAGNWAFGFAAADKALGRADAVAALHNADAECLRAVVPDKKLIVSLPFLDADPFLTASSNRPDCAQQHLKLLAVGMMREGDKHRSYEVLASALRNLAQDNWHLTIIGDGPMREQILDLFPSKKVDFLGALPPNELPKQYANHDLLVWPAIREAFGLALLEAQASGLGIIAGDTFGIPDIVVDGKTGLLSPEGDIDAFTENLARALQDPAFVRKMGKAARCHIQDNHTLTAGAERLETLLEIAVANHKDSQR